MFQTNSKDIAVAALEAVVGHSDDSRQVLIALRCLVRLRLAVQGDDGCVGIN